MGILSNLKKVLTKEEVNLKHVNSRTTEASSSIPKPTSMVAPPPLPRELKFSTFKQKINALLHFSLESLDVIGNWEPQIHIDGTPMKVKVCHLSTMVLGMFDVVVVAKLENGTTYYDFLSKKYAPNAILINFIRSCYETYGDDKYGKGVCTQRDTEPLKSGNFSRNWDNIDILQTKRADSYSLVIAMRITITEPEIN